MIAFFRCERSQSSRRIGHPLADLFAFHDCFPLLSSPISLRQKSVLLNKLS
jgi:hypothetical protein